jgi:hypothetical protein
VAPSLRRFPAPARRPRSALRRGPLRPHDAGDSGQHRGPAFRELRRGGSRPGAPRVAQRLSARRTSTTGWHGWRTACRMRRQIRWRALTSRASVYVLGPICSAGLVATSEWSAERKRGLRRVASRWVWWPPFRWERAGRHWKGCCVVVKCLCQTSPAFRHASDSARTMRASMGTKRRAN